MKKIKRDLSHDSKNLLAYQKDIENYKPLTKIQEEELGERILQGMPMHVKSLLRVTCPLSSSAPTIAGTRRSLLTNLLPQVIWGWS